MNVVFSNPDTIINEENSKKILSDIDKCKKCMYLMYSDSCIHCKMMEPEWVNFVKNIKNENSGLKHNDKPVIFRVESKNLHLLPKDYTSKLEGFPTVRYITDTTKIDSSTDVVKEFDNEYNERTEDKFKEFMNKHTQETISTPDKTIEFEDKENDETQQTFTPSMFEDSMINQSIINEDKRISDTIENIKDSLRKTIKNKKPSNKKSKRKTIKNKKTPKTKTPKSKTPERKRILKTLKRTLKNSKKRRNNRNKTNKK